jgi:hypothetical protein
VSAKTRGKNQEDPETGEPFEIALYGPDPSAEPEDGIRVLIAEQGSRYGVLTLERATPVDAIPDMVEDAVTNDQIVFEDDYDADEHRIVTATLEAETLIEDRVL